MPQLVSTKFDEPLVVADLPRPASRPISRGRARTGPLQCRFSGRPHERKGGRSFPAHCSHLERLDSQGTVHLVNQMSVDPPDTRRYGHEQK